jgi:hypothetical protein
MPFYLFHWTPEIIEHLSEHDVDQDDFDAIVQYPIRTGTTRKSNRPFAVGYAADGRELMCVFEWINDSEIEPVTAFEI